MLIQNGATDRRLALITTLQKRSQNFLRTIGGCLLSYQVKEQEIIPALLS